MGEPLCGRAGRLRKFLNGNRDEVRELIGKATAQKVGRRLILATFVAIASERWVDGFPSEWMLTILPAEPRISQREMNWKW